MRSVNLELLLCCEQYTKMPIFIDQVLDVKGLKEAMANILRSNIEITDGFYREELEDCVGKMDGPLIIDSLHYILALL